jgi:Arc/MetJ family transcription regulator
MATNLAIDDKLIVEALKIGHHKTKKEAVTTALKEYIAHKKQTEILGMFGKINFDVKYDYKNARKR